MPPITYIYRIQTVDEIVEHYEDDGEFGAGNRILEFLQKNDICDEVVCVTRWYGGTLLDPIASG